MQTEPIYDSVKIRSSFNNVFDKVNSYFSKNSDFQKLTSLTFKDQCESRIYEMLLSYLLKSESVSPGSPEILLSTLNDLLKKTLNLYDDNCALSLTKENVGVLLSSFAKEPIQKLAIEASNLAGLKGKIVLSTLPANGEKDILELSLGSFFPDVFPAFDFKFSKLFNPRLICIDGFIENVSEIHHILEEAAKSKEIIVLFVRGISEDVVHTLKVNYDRGTLTVIPIITKYDLDGANLLNDIAVSSGGDVVSSLKGQLISSIDIFSFPRNEAIDITSSGVLIENSSTSKSIDTHICNLQHKHMDSKNEVVKDFLTKRIQNLGTVRVSIKLADDSAKKSRSFEIDRCLRAIKSASTYGVSKWKDKFYPLASVKSGEFYANKFYDFFSSLGAIVT